MKSFKTSYDKEKNKEDAKIIFEVFPEKNTPNKPGSNVKKKKIILYLLIIILLVFLFVGSSILNQKVLYGNESNDYKLVNKFSGNYATIKPSDRSDLFKNIGFDVSKTKTETKNDKNYITTYAYRRLNEETSDADAISVYYDENYDVNYIMVSLIYKKSEFSISKTTADCNAILKNFINVNTPKNAISEVKSNGYYYLKDNSSKIEVSYTLSDKSKKYYVLTIIVEK